MDVPELLTYRLRMRAWRDGDLEALTLIKGDCGAFRFLEDTEPLTPDEVSDLLDDYVAEWEENGFGRWAVEEQRTSDLVGDCGFIPYDDDVGELTVMIARPYWGRGHASEAVRAAVRHGFEALRFNRVVGAAHPPNRAACRALEKLGLRHEEDIVGAQGLKLRLYSITALERRMASR
ncbi:MAG: GNAT family N-acetyltransferase [Chloroflexi bacterium]|nr:GNAT family N-acetyltransferase [Chloroflexota bacterium]